MPEQINETSEQAQLLEYRSQHQSLQQETSASTYAHIATSPNTRKAYRGDVRHFMAWGGVLPTTPDVVVRYLEAHADSLNPNTLKRRLTAIKNWHTYQHFSDPTKHALVTKTLSGIFRVHGRALEKAKAMTIEQLTVLTEYLKANNKCVDWRNNALLQVGFFGAFRRSELVSICWEHMKFVPQGVEITITRSKTDQAGEGHVCALPYGNDKLCPVAALQSWQEKTSRSEGPVFVAISKSDNLLSRALSSASISLIIKKLAVACCLPEPEAFSAHSMRRGFATSASQKGVSLSAIMSHGRWRSERTVLGYIEEGQRFEDNAAGLLLSDPV